MGYNFTNDSPIYLQIIEHIKTQIINNSYSPNQKIPSVRELSLLYEVNPNTIQKALSELENIGLIYTERTNGKFVTDDLKLINNIKYQFIDQLINKYLDSMENIGVNKNEAIKLIKNKENL